MDLASATSPNIVHGVRPTSDFTILANSFLRDERLSYRARGVLAEILTHGPDWAPDAIEMSRRGKEGRDAVLSSFAELEAAGYLVRERWRDVKTGKWQSKKIFLASPQVATTTENQGRFSRDGFPGTVNQEWFSSAGKPAPGFQAVYEVQKEEQKEELPSGPASASDGGPEVPDADGVGAVEPSAKIVYDAKPKTRIPDGFQVNPEMVAWCRKNFPAIDGKAQTDKFITYWRATPGAKGEKVNWDLAWMRWIRKAAEINGARAGQSVNGSPRKSTTDDRVRQALEAGERLQALIDGNAQKEIGP